MNVTGDTMVILSNRERTWPLFAVILPGRPERRGVAPVGMSRVLWVEKGARIAIVLEVAAASGLAGLSLAKVVLALESMR